MNSTADWLEFLANQCSRSEAAVEASHLLTAMSENQLHTEAEAKFAVSFNFQITEIVSDVEAKQMRFVDLCRVSHEK